MLDSPAASNSTMILPLIAVHHNGEEHRLKLYPGEEGLNMFWQELATITGRAPLQEHKMMFICKAPKTGQQQI